VTRKIIVHLGDHKTGSTSIQQVLSGGGIEAEQSLVFPVGTPRRAHHNHVARALIRKVKRKKHKKIETQYFAEMAAEIRASDADIAVISAENFEFADPAELKAALDKHLPEFAETTRLIAYIRPHGERLLSSYAERVKQGLFLGSLAEFHAETEAEGEFHYAPRLAQWRGVFGDSFTARPFLRARLKDGDVVTDFLDWLFEGVAFSVRAPAQTNEKLSVEDLALLREIQRRLEDVRGAKSAPREPVRALGWRLARMLSAIAGGSGTKLALDQGLVTQLQAAYGADAAATDAGFFEGTPLTEALAGLDAGAVPAPQSLELAEVVSPEAYRVSIAWIQLIHDLFILKPEEWRAYFQSNPLRADGLPQPGGPETLFPGLETEIGDLDLDWEDIDDDDDQDD
jgi:hypothetical protein